MRSLFLLFIVVLISACSTQSIPYGKFYHNNPFSSDTLYINAGNTFSLLINKEMLQEEVTGNILYEKNTIRFNPIDPQVGGYYKLNSTNDSWLSVYDLLTNEKICADFEILKNGHIVTKGNSCDRIERSSGDKIKVDHIGYQSYELMLDESIEDNFIEIHLAPDYYFLKSEYWDNWSVKGDKIVTPYEVFRRLK